MPEQLLKGKVGSHIDLALRDGMAFFLAFQSATRSRNGLSDMYVALEDNRIATLPRDFAAHVKREDKVEVTVGTGPYHTYGFQNDVIKERETLVVTSLNFPLAAFE